MQDLEITIRQNAQLLAESTEAVKALNSNVDAMLRRYTGIIYTSDTIADAKKDRAQLNKLSKEINARKIQVKKQITKPYEEYEQEVKKLIGKIDSVSKSIDAQVKEFEYKEKQDKKQIICDYWNSLETGVGFAEVFEEQWLNKGYTENQWKSDLDLKAQRFNRDKELIDGFEDPEMRIFFQENYKKYRDVGYIMKLWNDMQAIRKKAQQEQSKPLPEPQPLEEELPFAEDLPFPETLEEISTAEQKIIKTLHVKATQSQLENLMRYMSENDIEYWGD